VTAGRAPDAVALQVRAAAGGAADWAGLRAAAEACVACPELVSARTRVVFGQWPAGASVALLGEAPGAEEDVTGEPFVGRSGQLLDRLLGEAGVARADVAVLNVLKCRPPGNRKPAAVEAARCRGWLDRQLHLIDPWLLVPLGGSATEAVLGRGAKVTKVRGRLRLAAGRLVLPSYHPSAALRFGPAGEPAALLADDLGAVGRWLAILAATGARFAPATASDAPEVAALTAAAFGDPAEDAAAVAAELATGAGFVGRVDGVAVAAARVVPHRTAADTAWVRRVAVAPALRRRGLARVLHGYAEAYARTAGYHAVALATRAGAAAPAAAARRAGFAPVGEPGEWQQWRKDLE
jgi:uracil-DNA glycosylase